tara:strand:+ start:609 stop:863 length:255 start_codon:yes stop_codon:yes gene_type:complete
MLQAEKNNNITNLVDRLDLLNDTLTDLTSEVKNLHIMVGQIDGLISGDWECPISGKNAGIRPLVDVLEKLVNQIKTNKNVEGVT